LQKIQEELDRQMRPFREIQKLHDQLDPFRQMRDIQNQLARYSPEQQMRDMLKPFASERLLRDMLIPDTARSHVQSMIDALPKVSAHDKLLEQMQRQALGGLTMTDFARQIEQANPAFSAMEAARKSIDGILGTFRDLDLKTYPGKFDDASFQEAEDQFESISQAAAVHTDFQAAAEGIATAVAAQPNPIVRFFLWVHFRTLLNHIYGGIVGTAITMAVTSCMSNGDASKSPQEATKNIKEAARAVVTVSDMLQDQRYISGKVVVVRMNPRAKSPELGNLKFGNVVRVIKKDKNFTLVRWADKASGAEIQGWVFSRYLGKFN